MMNIKTQFEIRYSTILNFRTEYKSIISPYLKLCEFNISNVDSIEEYIVLTFRKDKYNIDCRWDRIIFIAEGIRDDLKKPQGPFFIFFEIFDKISKLASFGKIGAVLLAEWNLIEFELTSEELKAKFKQTYLPGNLTMAEDGFENEDFAINHVYGDQNEKSFKFTFGPFVPLKDFANYNLAPISKKVSEEWRSKVGIFSESILFQKVSNAEHETYKKTTKVIDTFLKKIKIDE